MTSHLSAGQLIQIFDKTITPYEQCCRWMRAAENIQAVRHYLDRENTAEAATREDAKHFLSFLMIHREKEEMIDESLPLDTVLQRVIDALVRRVKRSDTHVFSASQRIVPLFNAWKRRDKNVVVTYLVERALRASRQERDPDNLTSETLCHWIESIAGKEVADDTRLRCQRRGEGQHAQRAQHAQPSESSHRAENVQEEPAAPMRRITLQELPNLISNTMQDAYWDHVQDAVRNHDLRPLFDVLKHVQQAISALLTAAPVTKGNFLDRFDVDWIEDRAANDVLGRVDVGALVHYLVTIVASIQAPADDEEVGAWARQAQSASIQTDSLEVYLPTVVVTVRESIEHLKKVYRRLEDLQQQRV